jgi:hypothetical protein
VLQPKRVASILTALKLIFYSANSHVIERIEIRARKAAWHYISGDL